MSTTIRELLDDIRKQDIVIPEFQREYVWTREQAKQLMFSLYRQYPVGGLLLWKTDNPPSLKNLDAPPAKLGTVKILLDGQQRLTTLYMLILGETPNYYSENEISNDPRDLYFHLRKSEFQYYQPLHMKEDPMWQRVIDCFSDCKISIYKIAKQTVSDPNQQFALAEELNKNLNQLQHICECKLPVQIVPYHASLEEAIDIFDRINSQGTQLTAAELALTHATAKWPEARRTIKQKLEYCTNENFPFSLTFMTRALTATTTQRALLDTIHGCSREEIKAGWRRLEIIIDYLLAILPAQACIHSTGDMNTTNALIPIIAYLAHNDCTFPDQKSVNHAINWFYAALLWGRYTGQTDQKLEADLSIVAKEVQPWGPLRNQIIDQRGRIDVKSSDFEGRNAQHPLYRMAYVLAKANDARDWFNGAHLGSTKNSASTIIGHHVFPQKLLYKSGWNADNHLHRQVVNEIANRAFLANTPLASLSGKAPMDYLPSVEEKYPGILSAQSIPMDPRLWHLDRYEEFLHQRRNLLASGINDLLNNLISLPETISHRSIAELIKMGESTVLEFKSTLHWDVVKNQVNKSLRYSVLKTIVAFMNSEGGTLIIGVEDSGNLYGLDNDLKSVRGSTDQFEQLIVSIAVHNIGPVAAHNIQIRFEVLEGVRLCVIAVTAVRGGVYLKTNNGKQFYVRIGNTTQPLDSEDAHEYLLRKV